MINIAELIKDAPKGMKLYSPLFGEVEYMQLGDENKIWVKTSCGTYYFDKYGKPYAFDNAECLLFPSKDCRTWEGWKLPVVSKFKVGDWVVFNNSHNSIYQITEIKNFLYVLTHTHGGSMTLSFSQEELIRPWSIADVKDGDVLASIGKRTCPFIYRKTSYNNQLAYYYACIDGNGDFCEGCLKRTLYHFGSVTNVVPATKEQRDLLFAKMRETGYQWNAEKKELKKIPKHYDISNFHAGMPVLVRETNMNVWQYVPFSHCYTSSDGSTRFNASVVGWSQCIPFNDDTKHLLGTTDMCDEQYINW